MADTRPLPPGWVSQWDSAAGRYFFVDTTKNPPVSTWDDPRESNFDTPPPYTPSDESANKTPSMPMAMPSPNNYNNNYSVTSTYPSSDSKYPPYPPQPQQGSYPGQPQQGGYPGQGGYPNQPQPDSYTPYNNYNSSATASTSSDKPKKSGGFLSKLGLKPGKNHNKIPVAGPAAALGTVATLGALSHGHHHHHSKHGHGKKLLGGGLLGAATGLYVGHSLFKGFGGCDSGGWGGGDWGCGDW